MKSTKRSLLLSVLSLMMCVAMLIGTTYAWFTDSVTSGRNKIVAGNLDIELEYLDSTGAWKPVTTDTKLFDDSALWEPGHTEVAYIRLSNKGTLALKYNLAINIYEEVAGTNVAGDTFKLSDYIYMGVVEDQDTAYATRDEARAAVTTAGKIAAYTKAGSMVAGADEAYLALVVFMPETVGNEANYKTGTPAPSIEMGIEVAATQLASEDDSFDNLYDAAAPWLGGIDTAGLTENTDSSAKTVKIETAEQLAAFAKSVNDNAVNYAAYTITLESNIDLNNKAWTPISANANHSFVKFDGKGHTIKNLKVDQSNNVGLFGTLSGGDIENLTIDGANITGNDYAGAIIGTAYDSYIKNCVVKNAVVTVTPYLMADGKTYDGGAKAGAVVGYLTAQSNVSVENCKVENATVTAYRDLGGLVGYAQGAAKVTDNKIKDVTLKYLFAAPYDSNTLNQNIGDYYGRYDAGIIAYGNTGTATKGEANQIASAQELVMLANSVNGGFSFAGQTVKVVNNIDMTGIAWTPIGGNTMASYPGITFMGTFDGQEKTISNLTCSSDAPEFACAGLFGTISSGIVKNVKLENVDITSTHYAGAVVAYASNCGEIKNCHVKGGTVTSEFELIGSKYDNGDKAGGINGYGISVIDGCSVEGLTITGYRDIGGIAGCVDGATVTNNTVKDVTLVNNRLHDYKGADYDTDAKYDVNAIIGDKLNTVTDTNNDFTNVTIKVIKAPKVVVITKDENTQSAITAAISGAKAGETTNIVLPEGEYTITAGSAQQGSKISIKGQTDANGNPTTKINNADVGNFKSFKVAEAKFENVAFTGRGDANPDKNAACGFAENGNITYENCVFTQSHSFYNYGGVQTIKNCTFTTTNSDGYALWTYGTGTFNIIGCKFYAEGNSKGKAIKVYANQHQSVVNVTDCEFYNNSTKESTSKPAIAIGIAGANATVNVVVTGCTVNGFSETDDAMDPWYDNYMSTASQLDQQTVGAETAGDGGDLNNVHVTIGERSYNPVS